MWLPSWTTDRRRGAFTLSGFLTGTLKQGVIFDRSADVNASGKMTTTPKAGSISVKRPTPGSVATVTSAAAAKKETN